MLDSSSYNILHPKVQKWIREQNWQSLLEIQENSIPAATKGDRDMIISASTGGGKTEAAFLPILSRILYETHNTESYSVLYISPLRALINDQYRRLLDMVKGMGICVTPWHSDISESTKSHSLQVPNGILIITPESLESFLMNRSDMIQSSFNSLKYVVIDELHSFIGTERGIQLISLLSRIEIAIKQVVPRIALSATLADFNDAATYLRPHKELPVFIPQSGDSKHEIMVSLKELIYSNWEEEIECNDEITEDIFRKLRGTSNLVFTNSRAEVENLTAKLADRCEKERVSNEFRAHHGSISSTERKEIEKELVSSIHPVTTICTSTLELGIDIGKVKSIAQVGVCNSVSSLRQRLGRSGRRGEPSILRIYSKDLKREDRLSKLYLNLVQNIAVIELLKEKKYENRCKDSAYHFSTLVQQILSCVVQYGCIYPSEAWILLCRKGMFTNISVEMFLLLIRELSIKSILSMTNNQMLTIGIEGEKLVKKLNFYATFAPEREISVFDDSTRKEIGSVQILFKIGTLLILGGRRWTVLARDARARTLIVKEVKDGGNATYFGGGADVERIVTEKMREVLLSNEIYSYLDITTMAPEALIEARKYFRDNLTANSTSNPNGLTMTWAGSIINRTICLAAKKFIFKEVRFSHIHVDLSITEIQEILENQKPDGNILAEMVPLSEKKLQINDYLLPEQLLNLEFSTLNLDIDGAWEVMEKICNQGVSKQ